jgi:Tol biopolymer transport system component
MSDKSGGRELYLLDLTSNSEQRLTNNGVYDGLPDWQPDGTLVLFGTVRAPESGGEFEIYLADVLAGNADQTNARQLTVNTVGDDDPAWSPDGRSIVYQTFLDGNWDLWIIPAGGVPQPLVDTSFNETSPDWGWWSPE